MCHLNCAAGQANIGADPNSELRSVTDKGPVLQKVAEVSHSNARLTPQLL